MGMAAVSEDILIAQLRDRLNNDFGRLSPQDVQGVVARAQAKFASSPIRDFVPLFVERYARAELSRMVTEVAS